jgi:hypothetical protein
MRALLSVVKVLRQCLGVKPARVMKVKIVKNWGPEDASAGPTFRKSHHSAISLATARRANSELLHCIGRPVSLHRTELSRSRKSNLEGSLLGKIEVMKRMHRGKHWAWEGMALPIGS